MLQGVLNIDVKQLNKDQFKSEYEDEINLINTDIKGYLTSHDELLIRKIKSLEDFKESLRHTLNHSRWTKDLKEHKSKLELKQSEQGDINKLLTTRKQTSDEIQNINSTLEKLKEVETSLTNLETENQEIIKAILNSR
ncbi:hypothetical protein [Metabacillus fastidiosus]|uniref:hypothetical protein n=1 Tax=Metabacillus fastidiosus TaxID=1458 RepID=UPI002E231F67|nr:hypothetical protein [Metabacillus fastidiosus]